MARASSWPSATSRTTGRCYGKCTRKLNELGGARVRRWRFESCCTEEGSRSWEARGAFLSAEGRDKDHEVFVALSRPIAVKVELRLKEFGGISVETSKSWLCTDQKTGACVWRR